MSDILVAFRTHNWNPDSQRLAFKLSQQTSEFDFVILADETQNEFSVKPFEKVSHTDNMEVLGLPAYFPAFRGNLHHNGDYALYFLRKAKPDYKLYFMLENDACVNIDIETLLQQCIDSHIDFIGVISYIAHEQERKIAEPILQRYFSDSYKIFFPFIIASAPLIDALYQKRLELAEKEKKPHEWLYCEHFVGSFLISNPQFTILPLEEVADVSDFTWLDHKHIDDPRVYRNNTIIHPVTSTDFVNKHLRNNNIESLFNRHSILSTGLRFEDPQNFLPILKKHIERRQDHDLWIKFENHALAQGWIPRPDSLNIALGKPAVQSSICPASRYQDVRLDAALLIDGILEPTSRSHTDFEAKPWVMIDLLESHEIRAVVIYVRPDCFPHFCDFSIHISQDQQEWECVYKKMDGIVPDSGDMKPIPILITRGKQAKFVKIIQENPAWMHLNQVEIYSY